MAVELIRQYKILLDDWPVVAMLIASMTPWLRTTLLNCNNKLTARGSCGPRTCSSISWPEVLAAGGLKPNQCQSSYCWTATCKRLGCWAGCVSTPSGTEKTSQVLGWSVLITCISLNWFRVRKEFSLRSDRQQLFLRPLSFCTKQPIFVIVLVGIVVFELCVSAGNKVLVDSLGVKVHYMASGTAKECIKLPKWSFSLLPS